MAKTGVKKALNSSIYLLIKKRHYDLEFFVSRMECRVPHFYCCIRRIDPILKDVAILIMLAIYVEKNAMGVILGENNTGEVGMLTLP